jgi:hypothetical protein
VFPELPAPDGAVGPIVAFPLPDAVVRTPLLVDLPELLEEDDLLDFPVDWSDDFIYLPPSMPRPGLLTGTQAG